MKKRIISVVISLALVILLGGELLLSLFAVNVSAAEGTSTTYSNVLEDLKKDSSFNENNFSIKENENEIQLIHVAEGDSGELFVYTYQPGNETNHRKANYINMSLENPTAVGLDKLQYKRYSLTWLNSNGLFDKYIVNGFKVSDLGERFYNISGIYRPYDSSVDSSSSSEAIDTVQCKSYPVGQYWRLYYYNDVLIYESKKIDVVEYKVYATGTVRYADGFIPTKPFTVSNTDSHYVAFSITNYSVDQIIDADITYDMLVYEYDDFYRNDFVIPDPKVIPVKSELIEADDEGFNDGSGWFGKKYTWQRILTTTDFKTISEENANEKFSADEIEGLKKSQFVFAFKETEWKKTYYFTGDDVIGEYNKYTVIENFGLLRLKFISNYRTYNLGAVGDLVGTDNIPDLFVDIKDNIQNSFEEMFDWIKILLIVLMIVFIFTVFSGPVTFILRILYDGVKFLIKMAWWAITLPFRLIAFFFKSG